LGRLYGVAAVKAAELDVVLLLNNDARSSVQFVGANDDVDVDRGSSPSDDVVM